MCDRENLILYITLATKDSVDTAHEHLRKYFENILMSRISVPRSTYNPICIHIGLPRKMEQQI